VKWLLPENDQQEALVLQDLYVDEKINLIAPQILVIEVASALAKRCRREELSPAAAHRCFDQLIEDSPALHNSEHINRAAFRLAVEHRRPIYDCLYLALALDHGCDLVTADEKFVSGMQGAFPCVCLLKDYVKGSTRSS
jgi:predicted nucleic acid-binding protein